MTPWFRTYRENVEDPQNSMLSEMYQLIIQERQKQIDTSTPTDTERKRVVLLTSHSFLIFISDGCFVIGKQRYLKQGWKWYLGREPDGNKCRCWFDFDYRSNVIFDRSLRGNNAILKGSPTIIAYQPEYPSSSLSLNLNPNHNAVLFDGSDDYINCGNEPQLWSQSLTKFSFSFWFYATDFGESFLINHGMFDNNAFGLWFNPAGVDNSLDFRMISNTGVMRKALIPISDPAILNAWHHVTCTYDNSLGSLNLKIYLDGVPGSTTGEDSFTESINKSNILRLAEGFGGKIRDLRWWTTKALTQQEVLDVKDNATSAPTPDYWLKMDEGVNHPLDSISGNLSGVLTNGASWVSGVDLPPITPSYVDMGNNDNLNVGITANSEITYTLWIYFDDYQTYTEWIMQRGEGTPFIIHLNSQGSIRCDFTYNDLTGVTLYTSNNSEKGVWHSVVATHSDITDISKFYVDGVLIGSNVKNNYMHDSGSGSEDRFMVGARATGATSQEAFFEGNIKDVRVYSRAITETEALKLYLGEEISTVGLVSQWEFNEDSEITKAVDSHGYNTGTIVNGIFDKTLLPTVLSDPFPYEDGMIDKLIGYKTSGQYLVIPELEDDFSITGKTTGGLWYRWEVKLTTFDVQNDNQMRLLEKADDDTLTYFQSYQIGSDGKFYCFGIFNGVTKKIRTVNQLKLLKKYDIIAGIDYDSIAGGVATNIFKIYIDGFIAATEITTVDPNFPAATDITTFSTFLLAGNEVQKGNFVGQIYSFRYYEEDITTANALGLMTNRFTTYNIDRGHVVRPNITKLPLSLAYRLIKFGLSKSLISDSFDYTQIDPFPTGRFNNIASQIPISDDFDFVIGPPDTPEPTLGNYSIDITNTSNIHSWVEVTTIDPVRDHFSVFAWVKYRGRVGDWAGVISAIDGLDNGNRILIKATQIRCQFQFDRESNDWKDFRVTVPSITDSWHLIGFTHNGDENEFKIYLDGARQKTFYAHGDIRGTDRSKTFIGKGSNNGYYLDGLVDDLFIYKRTLSQSDVTKLWMKKSVTHDLMAHYSWERTFKDVEDGNFNGRKVGTIVFSSDHV